VTGAKTSMRKIHTAVGTLLTCLLAACTRSAQTPVAAPTAEHQVIAGRRVLLEALQAQQLFTAERLVVHVAHVCNLVIGKAVFPVVDLQELVKGVAVPRGVNAILVLNPNLRLLRRIEYATERPLFCRDNRLYVWGDLTIDGVIGEGNELTLGLNGEITKLSQIEANDVPAPAVGHERPR